MLVLYAGAPFTLFLATKGHIDKAGRGIKAAMSVGLLGGAIVVAGFFLGVSQRTNPSPALSTPNLVPYLDLAAGIAGVIVYCFLGYYAVRNRGNKLVAHKALAVTIIAAAASCYLVGVAIDHWVFWHATRESGLMSEAVYGAASDVKCNDGFIAIHREDTEKYRWRCAMNLVLGPPLSQPFIPWPAYREGISSELYGVTQMYLQKKQNPSK
ncbi:hypothetical protein [Herbaspirillum sp. RV1423]|uniref:hypothetical protein n=1 Tax=Herbaspirillum sp. RV1423 TaxID=1443993 RepID=UPI0012DCE002|nr:hypothetical protein [Herbaspirillum sp. RV1423]